ncbi:MAG: methyltransferase [Spirochaetes bacterium GWB1_66_5]|nr:MAG: methyltransferase [Spirochaetes bacterium GWB1_66_5]
MGDDFKQMKEQVQAGEAEKLKELIKKALASKVAPMEIIEKALRPALEEVGQKFETLEIFLPEMIMAADAMAAGVEILRPLLAAAGGEKKVGRVVLGTVSGDVHRIGKDIVRIMLEGAGFDVTDAGHDVPDDTFLAKVKELKPDILGLSALMTTTMQNIPRVIEALKAEGLRGKVKVIVGGAPVLSDWAKQIGSDGYGENAVQAVSVSKKLVG